MNSRKSFKHLLRGSAMVTLANMVATGLGLMFLLATARYLDPVGVAIVMGVVAIIDGGQHFLDTTVNTGMVTLASKRGKSGRPDPGILKSGFLSKLLASVLLAALVVALSAPVSSALLGSTEIALLVAVAGGAAAVAGMQGFVQGVLQAREAFLAIALLTPVKNLLRLAAVGVVWLIGPDDPAQALGLLVCAIPVLACLIFLPVIQWAFLHRSVSIVAGLFDLARVQGWMALTAVAMFAGRMDIWIVGIVGSPEQAGLFAVAAQLCVGVGVLTQAVITTFLPTVSRFETTDQAIAFLRQWMRLVPLLFVIPLLAWPVAEPGIVLLFGAEYAPSTPIFLILLLGSVMTLAGAPLMLVLLSVGEARILAAGTFLQMVLRIGLGVLALPVFGGTGYALADIASRLLAMTAIGFFILRVLRGGGPLTKDSGSAIQPAAER